MFPELLARVAGALEAAKLPYMVIGGQAVLLHGEPRLTRDVDLTLGAGLERLESLVAAIPGMGLRALVSPDEFTRRTLVLPCEDLQSRLRVDFIFSFTPYERQAIERAQSVSIGGAKVRFASPEDLVVHKILAGRPRDIEDVRGVIRRNPGLDVGEIQTWLGEIGAAVEEPLLDRFNAVLAQEQAAR